jgi:hypothetical protein
LQEIKNKDVSMFNKLDNFLKIYKKYSTYVSKIENIKKIRDIITPPINKPNYAIIFSWNE